MTLNQIIFEHIDDKYAYGKYGDFKVIMMTKNRYINATKLCKEYNKEFKHWKENKSNQELIIEVEKEIFSADGIPTVENKSFIIINGGKNQLIKGTYVHELLIPHIASWISSKFAIKVSKIINSYISNEYINEIRDKNNKICNLEEKLNIIIEDNKETKIINDKLLKSNEELLKQSKKAEKQNRKLEQKLDEANDNLTDIKDELCDSNKKLNYACKKLDVAVEDRVPKTEEYDKLESIAILKCIKKKALFRYYCIRGQLYHVNKRIKKKTIEEKYEEIIRIDDVTHSVNLWNRLKEKLRKKVEYCGNEMNLIDINENDFIDTIKNVYDKRKEIIIEENNRDDTSDDE